MYPEAQWNYKVVSTPTATTVPAVKEEYNRDVELERHAHDIIEQ